MFESSHCYRILLSMDGLPAASFHLSVPAPRTGDFITPRRAKHRKAQKQQQTTQTYKTASLNFTCSFLGNFLDHSVGNPTIEKSYLRQPTESRAKPWILVVDFTFTWVSELYSQYLESIKPGSFV